MNSKLTFIFLSAALLVSCTPLVSPTVSDLPKETRTPLIASFQTVASVPFAITATITPEITTTPLPFDASTQNLTEEIDNLYNSRRGSCDEIRHFNIQESTPLIFGEVTNQTDFSKVEIQQIADNIDGSNRAYVLSEYFCGTNNPDCRKNVIYWQDNVNSRIYRIEWIEKDLFLHLSVTWFGKDFMVIREAAFPGSFGVIGINVDTQEFVYGGSVKNCS